MEALIPRGGADPTRNQLSGAVGGRASGAPISIDKASLRAVFRGGSFVDGAATAATASWEPQAALATVPLRISCYPRKSRLWLGGASLPCPQEAAIAWPYPAMAPSTAGVTVTRWATVSERRGCCSPSRSSSGRRDAERSRHAALGRDDFDVHVLHRSLL